MNQLKKMTKDELQALASKLKTTDPNYQKKMGLIEKELNANKNLEKLRREFDLS